jgi:hypothetical protein
VRSADGVERVSLTDLDIEVKLCSVDLLMDSEPKAPASEVVLEVDPDDLQRYRLQRAPIRPLDPGEALFEVERFSLTANNLTYASEVGRQVGYWDLFPAEPKWGRIPAWGYLRAVASRQDEIAVGSRFYGFCPPGSHVVMSPERVSASGFGDGAPHRAAMGPVYNAYSLLDADPGYDDEIPDRLLFLRPLFWLSFMLVDHLEQNGLLDRQVVITSASSKAGLGAAHLLSRLGARCVGVTSPVNRDLVVGLGLYANVIEYDDLDSLPSRPTVLLDLAGDASRRAALAASLGASLEREVLAGFTHRGAAAAPADFFFVPDEMRARAKQLGWPALNERFCRALKDFARASDWMHVEVSPGPDAVLDAYRGVFDNSNVPTTARLLSLTP